MSGTVLNLPCMFAFFIIPFLKVWNYPYYYYLHSTGVGTKGLKVEDFVKSMH